MGYGDFKLLAALGAWMGWDLLPVIILLSSLTGVVVGISLILFFRTGSNHTDSFWSLPGCCRIDHHVSGETID